MGLAGLRAAAAEDDGEGSSSSAAVAHSAATCIFGIFMV